MEGALFVTRDGGGSWSLVASAGWGVSAVAADPSAPDTIAAGLRIDTFITHKSALALSLDGGSTWDFPGESPTFIYALVFDPVFPHTLYASGLGGLFRSVDLGRNWTLLLASNPHPFQIAVAPGPPHAMYAVAGSFFRSFDAGETWHARPIGDTDAISLALDPASSRVLYAGTYSKGVFRSDDRGETWVGRSQGLPGGAVRALVADPNRPGVVFAAVSGAGVFRSEDRGQQWTVFDRLPSRDVFQLFADPTFDVLHAALPIGVFEHSLSLRARRPRVVDFH